MATTSAVEMAKQAEIDPKRFRKALRDENFSWHTHNDRWTVDIGSEQHAAMERVLSKLECPALDIPDGAWIATFPQSTSQSSLSPALRFVHPPREMSPSESDIDSPKLFLA